MHFFSTLNHSLEMAFEIKVVRVSSLVSQYKRACGNLWYPENIKTPMNVLISSLLVLKFKSELNVIERYIKI